ncbi:MAG: hypothetical protein SFY66_09870 [Oculatellaceae cyanobacterium bins.114]|nr:hypothetical protein [Oculatellaceae cyanobacterium bins.114]
MDMKLQRSQLSLLGLIVLLAGCAGHSVSLSSAPPTVAVTSSPSVAGSGELASKPFQELLIDTAANPPRLIPELSPAPTSTDLATDQRNLPSVSVNLSGQQLPPVPVVPGNAPLLVPVPPAPTVIRTVPIPNPAPSILPAAPVAAPSQATVLPVRTAPLPPRSPSAQPQAVAARPIPPNTPNRLAESIVVTGVVQVGDVVSAIVQVPNEQSSRYVRVGDSLANGRVVVDRIEMMADGEPRVILLQDGVETIRTVGNF